MKGLVIKRVQYARDPKTGRRFKWIKTVADLWRILAYLDEETHRNHEGIKLESRKYWRCAADAFLPQVEAQLQSYLASKRGKPGRPWSGKDIAEHVVVAPPAGSDLTDDERESIALGILNKICPNSPAAYAWHWDGENKRWDLHLVMSSFTDSSPAKLRVTEVRRRGGADYKLLLDEAGMSVVSALNTIRHQENRPAIRTLAMLKAEKIDDVVRTLALKAEGRGIAAPTVAQILEMLTDSNWSVKKAGTTSVSIVSAVYSTPLHIKWTDLLYLVAHSLAALAMGREQSKHAPSSQDTEPRGQRPGFRGPEPLL